MNFNFLRTGIMKQLVVLALGQEYGFAPIQGHIILLADGCRGDYILCQIWGHKYEIKIETFAVDAAGTPTRVFGTVEKLS